MTRAPGELLRDVATALACYASTKHAQAHVQKNQAIKAEMLLEVDRIEALEREVRDAAKAQAGAGEDQFEREWAALPTGEGVTLDGEPLPGEDPTPERLERAHAFMRRLESEDV